MKITPGHILMPLLAIAVGAALIFAGLSAHWGVVWAAGGLFFITIGLSTALLSLAWVAPGPVGNVLRSWPVSAAILLAILSTLCLTVFLGLFE